MTPRSFYRSRLFWLGLPGLVFLLWGWWLSIGHFSQVAFVGGPPWMIGQCRGEVFAYWFSDGWPDWQDINAMHLKSPVQKAHEFKVNITLAQKVQPTLRYVFIPYYWPVLAYTATWLLTLAWWQRRKARVIKLLCPP